MKSTRRGSPFERARMARLAAVQAQYQLFLQDQSAESILTEFIQDRFSLGEYVCQPEVDLFQSLVRQASARQVDIQTMIESSLNADWQFDRLELVLKALLYIATAELLTRPTAVPAPVIIKEYVSIAYSFFSGKEPVYLNGYLDRLARQLDYPMARPEAEVRF